MRKLFIDTANLDEIVEANQMGVIGGVTTNPTIISKEPKGDFDSLLKRLAEYCGKERLSLSVEIFATEKNEMVDQALALNETLSPLCKMLHIKIPVGVTELKVIKEVSCLGVKVNCTCCYTEQQLQMAAAAGAKYVSLFYARLRDIGGDPNKVLNRTTRFLTENNYDTKIIAGSIRSALDVSDSWENGANIATTSLSVIKSMAQHPQTTSSVNKFLEDFKAWRG
jgi:transaldolase